MYGLDRCLQLSRQTARGLIEVEHFAYNVLLTLASSGKDDIRAVIVALPPEHLKAVSEELDSRLSDPSIMAIVGAYMVGPESPEQIDSIRRRLKPNLEFLREELLRLRGAP